MVIEKVKVHTVDCLADRYMHILVHHDTPVNRLSVIKIDGQLHRINRIYSKPDGGGTLLEIDCSPMKVDTVNLV